MRSLVWMVLMALSTAAWAEPQLRPYSVTYSVRYSGFPVGEMTQQLSRDADDVYTLTTVAKTSGIVSWFKPDVVTERSTWRFDDDRPQPLHYVYKYSGRSKDVVERQDFDWDADTVTTLRDGRTKVLTVQPGTLDKQLFQVALREDLEGGPKQLSYPVIERDKLTTYQLKILGEEQVETPAGHFHTIKVSKGTTTMWLAPELQYLIVRIEQHDGGTTATSVLTDKKFY